MGLAWEGLAWRVALVRRGEARAEGVSRIGVAWSGPACRVGADLAGLGRLVVVGQDGLSCCYGLGRLG